MRLTTLIENHGNNNQPDLLAEHGLSFFIENQGHFVMSDVGQSGKFADNAEKLGVDIALVEGLAISHHHYDHGGGLGRFFTENRHAKVYLHDFSAGEPVAVDPSGQVRQIGLDRGLLSQNEDRLVWVTKSQEPLPGFHLITEIPDAYQKPSGDQRLKVRSGDRMTPDTFSHEMVTVLRGKGGLVILTGCAHNGVLNMIEAAGKAFPGQPIQAVIGGFHLHHEDDEVVKAIGHSLVEEEIPAIYTGHCTGEKATDLLEEILGSRLHRLYTGLVMNFD
jgi:7,8-dihydropterin-6-yl-methyl-4-(beta-D-ribofuranosyl)aminobenzene 5'-phosphate synthase